MSGDLYHLETCDVCKVVRVALTVRTPPQERIIWVGATPIVRVAMCKSCLDDYEGRVEEAGI